MRTAVPAGMHTLPLSRRKSSVIRKGFPGAALNNCVRFIMKGRMVPNRNTGPFIMI